jgi:hypothetical protein
MSSSSLAVAAALAPIARAIDAVMCGEALDPTVVDSLLPTLRALPLAAAPLAGADEVDVGALVQIVRRRPALLQQSDDHGPVWLDVEAGALDPRGTARAIRVARSVLDAVVVALEAKKLTFGFTAVPTALKAAFSTPEDARALLLAVRALDGRVGVSSSSPPSTWTATVPADREIHVVAGAVGRRLVDLLSPAVRRLRVELALAGRRGGVIDDDDVYRGLERLFESDPDTVSERRAHDATEGVIETDDGGGFIVDTAALNEELVDRRARGLIAPLKKARVAIVGVVDPSDLGAVLAGLGADGHAVRSLQLLVPATRGTRANTDDERHDDEQHDHANVDDGAIIDAASGHLWPGTATRATVSSPWLALAPTDVAADEGAFALQQAAARWRLVHPSAGPVRLFRSVDDDSDVVLQALAAMVALRAR